MKTGFDNIYYLCKTCDKVFDSYQREYKGDLDKSKLIKGHCEKCFKQLEKKVKIINWDYDIVENKNDKKR